MQDFTAKQKNLFACLDDASKELEGTSLDQTNVERYTENEFRGRSSRLNRNNPSQRQLQHGRNSSPEQLSLSALRGKESIFKKPEMPILKCLKPRRTPDYQINPHKWQKYSLADVDISDQTNKSAAFASLKQIEDLRDAQIEQAENESGSSGAADGKIQFKKSSHVKRTINATTTDEATDAQLDRPKLKGSKLIMPEYVVGQKQQNKRKRSATQIKRTEQVKPKLTLSHLVDDEELEG